MATKPKAEAPDTGAKTETEVADTSSKTLIGSSFLPAVIAIHGKAVQLGDIVARAHEKSGLSVDAWNALDGAAIEERLVLSIVDMAADMPKAVLMRIRDFQFGSDERPSPATRAVIELQKIATEGLKKIETDGPQA